MGIYRNGRGVINIYHNNRPIAFVYRSGRLVWPDVMNMLMSCFAHGYWIDEYPWTDDLAWTD